jgi:hypothetical protein
MGFHDYPHKVGWCGYCGQGWLIVAKEAITKKLWIICAECDTAYDTPKDMIDSKCLHNQQSKIGHCEPPVTDEIVAIGWDSYILERK